MILPKALAPRMSKITGAGGGGGLSAFSRELMNIEADPFE